MKFFHLFIYLFLAVSLVSFAQQKEKTKIFEIMQMQEKAWNEGKLEKFMSGYWQSDSLKFIGKKGITWGWKNTLENYQKNYPDSDARGTLKFDILHFEFLGKKDAFMIGKWKIIKKDNTFLEGHFTLIWKKLNKEWKIIADHSS